MPWLADLGRFFLRRLARPMGYLLRRRVRKFERVCRHPEIVQRDLLMAILRRQADTAYGRDHRFREIASIDDYRRQIAIGPYESLKPYVDRVAAGETNALIANGPVRLLALTSGTTMARKLIPVTDDFLSAYRSGWNMWGAQLFRDHRPRRLFARPIVQMVGEPVEFHTEAGVPCGNMSGYTAMVQKRIVKRFYALPHQTGSIKDSKAKYYTALRLSIGRPCSLFLAANPSTLIALGRTLGERADELLKDLHDGTLRGDLDVPGPVREVIAPRLKADPKRARELSAILSKTGSLKPSDVWPSETILIGCWTGGSMGPYLRQLPEYFGEVPIRDLGLIASEGRFSIPFADGTPSGVLDISANYYEFIPEREIDSAQPTVLGAHELSEGGVYSILPTTSSGLYRYLISDLVRVTGFLGRTPLIEFLSKGSRFSNLTGEKLSEHHVTKAFDAVSDRLGVRLQAAYAVAPVWDDRRPFYVLVLESRDGTRPESFLADLDLELRLQNDEYEAKRQSDRLGPIRLKTVRDGFWYDWDRETLAARGGSPEQFKHPCLIGDLKFASSL